MDVFQIAASISTAFGLIAFVAALYFRNLATLKERSIRGVIGDEIAYPALEAMLGRFSSDAERLRALELLLNHDRERAKALLSKVKEQIDPLRLAALDARRYFGLLAVGGVILLALAALAFFSRLQISPAPRPPSRRHPR